MPTKFFGTVRQKIFDGKLWYPLLCIKFFDTPNFLKHWRDAHEIFRHCETKNFRRKIVIPPIMHKIFRYPKVSETLKGGPRNFSGKQKGSFTKLFVSVQWDKNFDGKYWYSPPPLIQTFSVPEISETLKGSPLRKFLAQWDKKLPTENRKSWHNPLKHKYFRYPKVMKH